MSESGEYFVGCNVENASYSLTLCAEASAISQMVAAGQRHIQAMVLLSLSDEPCQPCGACRQRLYEFSGTETKLMIGVGKHPSQQVHTYTMSDLLPHAFVLNQQEQNK
jgi:cytidine deaminase